MWIGGLAGWADEQVNGDRVCADRKLSGHAAHFVNAASLEGQIANMLP